MRRANTKKIALLLLLVLVMFFSGCTDWKKKYNQLDTKYRNTLGLLQAERDKNTGMVGQLTLGQQTIEELQRQIEELEKTPGAATGFGDGMAVSFDPSAGTITVTLDNQILFPSGKAELKSVSSAELNHIASVINSEYSGKQIDVVGHTDNDPIKKSSWKDNWELSAQRSLTVVRYLTSKGLASERIRAVGCGESQPVAPNTSASGKAKNRRVEIVVHLK